MVHKIQEKLDSSKVLINSLEATVDFELSRTCKLVVIWLCHACMDAGYQLLQT